jgi:hypothetical protein
VIGGEDLVLNLIITAALDPSLINRVMFVAVVQLRKNKFALID